MFLPALPGGRRRVDAPVDEGLRDSEDLLAPRLAPVHFAIHGRFVTSFRVSAVVRATAWLVLFANLGYYQVSFQGDTFETLNSGCIPRVTIRHIG